MIRRNKIDAASGRALYRLAGDSSSERRHQFPPEATCHRGAPGSAARSLRTAPRPDLQGTNWLDPNLSVPTSSVRSQILCRRHSLPLERIRWGVSARDFQARADSRMAHARLQAPGPAPTLFQARLASTATFRGAPGRLLGEPHGGGPLTVPTGRWLPAGTWVLTRPTDLLVDALQEDWQSWALHDVGGPVVNSAGA